MKILRILTRPNVGGPTRQAVHLWHAQTALGHRCLTVTGTVGADEAGFDFAALGIPRLDVSAAIARGDDAEGFVQLAELVRTIAPLRDFRAYRTLRRLMRAFRPDVVHTHTSKAGLVGRTAALREGVPVIAHTFHGHVLRDYYPRPISWGLCRLESYLARRSQLLFAISKSCAEELAALRVSSTWQVIHPAVETAAFTAADRSAARARLGVTDDRLILAFVGRLVKIKRVDRFAAVIAAMPDAIGVVFGEGPHQPPDFANLRCLGTRTDLHDWLPGCDVLVMPSEREGFPLTAVEAAACGIPTVGFEVPGLTDVVAESGLGMVVPAAQGIAGLVAAVRTVHAQAPDITRARALCQDCDPARIAALLSDEYEQARSEDE